MNLKLFGKNAVIYMVGNIGLRATSFLLIPLYTYSLSVSEFGLLSTLLITIQVMIMAMSVGTEIGFVRFAAEYDKKNLLGHLLGSSIMINIAGGIIVTAVSLLLLLPFFRSVLHTDQVLGYIIIACCVAMSQSLCIHIMNYYRARNDGLRFMFASVSAAIVLIIITFILLFILNQGIKGALIAQIISYGGIWLLISLRVFSNIGIGVSIQLILKLLRFSFPLVFAMTGFMIMNASVVYFLSYFRGLEEVAIYSLGFKMAEIAGMVLLLPFQLAYEPFVYANINTTGIRESIAKLLTYLMICFAFIALGIVFFSRDLLHVIAPPEYFPAYLIIFLLLPAISFRGIRYVGESLLHIKNKTYVTGFTDSVFTILCVMLAYLLIPRWGIYGAIFAFSVRLVSIAVCLMIFGMKSFAVPLQYIRLGIAGVLLAFFLLTVFFLRERNILIYYSLIPLVVCSSVAVLYFGNFFDDQEKMFIKDTLLKIQSKVNNVRSLRGLLQ